MDAGTFAVTDQDGGDTTRAYSVTGDDREVLAFDSSDILGFMAGHESDFEEKSSYSITVVARSGAGHRRLSSTLDVTVEVVDTEDVGAVVLSQRQPQEGITVHATASDPDGGVRISRWVWERSDAITVDDDGAPSAECRDDPGTPGIGVVGGWASIDGATSLSYTPASTDVGRCLRATAFYTDNIENPTDADDEATGSGGSSRTEQQDRQRRSGVRGPRPQLTGRPVGQDEPEGGGEHRGQAEHRGPGQRLRR